MSCHAHAVLCRGLQKSLSERHGRGMARVYGTAFSPKKMENQTNKWFISLKTPAKRERAVTR
jgi:hypothetical protein